jgi:hypothetical protein
MTPEERDAAWQNAMAFQQAQNRQIYPNPFGGSANVVPDNPAVRAPLQPPQQVPQPAQPQPQTAPADSWQSAEKVQKNDQGEFRALINGQWVPAVKAQKNEAGEYRVLLPSSGLSVMDAIKTVGHLAIPGGPALKLADMMTQGATEAGGRVTDVTGSPAAGYAANVALQSIPLAAGGPIGRLAAPAMRTAAENMMQRALKPSLGQLKNGEAATAIDTMLSEGLNATKGGVAALKEKIGQLNDEIKTAIENSPAVIKTSEVGKALVDTMKRFQNQVNPQMDLDVIKNAWAMFKNHPLIQGASEIPVQLAQDLKTGTQQMLRKKYGQLGTADVEAQKGIARGLREEISTAVPEVAPLNAQESKLIQTLNVTEKRAMLDLNKDVGGLAWLAHNPGVFLAYMADKSALFKSLVARMLNAGKEQIPATAARAGVAGYDVSNQE